MKHPLFIRFLIGILLCLATLVAAIPLLSLSAQAHGAYNTHNKHITTSHSTSSASVTIIVLDMSGSMSQNDPNGLRCSAANAYIDLSGPGNFIGVVGLDNISGSRGGPHTFQQAQVWNQPMEMATLAQRQQLQHIIATRSNNCQPDNTTPTYDSLNQALQMLNSATNGGQVPGSVVLLTDGVPDPDTITQMNAIQSDLLPQFRQHSWSIDTVALGTDGPVPGTNTTFHSFLSGISDATAGKFYDDGHGVVPGVSPLNIAAFFVDIFARHNHRIVQNDIPPTTLDGGTTRRNFSVTDYTNSLDIVVVKDQAATKAVLITPSGQTISQSGSGVFVSSFDPHYEVFSIQQPQSGQWELDVTGSGQFLMNSLKVSGIGLSPISISQANLAIAQNSALALGQPLTVSANLTYNGQPITDNRFTMNGVITYSGALGQFNQTFALDDKNTPGTYTGSVTIPGTAPPGSYEIVINASTVSLQAAVSSQNRSVRIELFPVPLFISPQTQQPTPSTVESSVIQWDPVLRVVYGLPFWPMTQLSQWALNNTPAQPSADVAGEVQLQQQLYSAATVSAVANSATSHATIPVTVVNDGNGRFHALFPSSANGVYIVTFQTSGSFADSHGDFGTTQRTVRLTTVPATGPQEFHAWTFTVIYLLCLVFLYYLLRFMVLPKPRGEWQRFYEGDRIGSYRFNQASRGLWQWFVHPDLLYSKQAKMPKGLLFRFQRGAIEVRSDGRDGGRWRNSDGSSLSRDFRGAYELRYQAGREDDIEEGEADNRIGNGRHSRFDEVDESATYLISSREERQKRDDSTGDDEDKRPSRRRQRKTQSSRSNEDYEDYGDERPVSRGKSRKQGKQRRGDEDDD